MPFSTTAQNIVNLLTSLQNDESLSELEKNEKINSAIQLVKNLNNRTFEDSKELNFREAFQIAEEVAQIGHWSINHLSGTLNWSNEVYKIFEIDNFDYTLTLDDFYQKVLPEDVENVKKAFHEHIEKQFKYDVEHRIITFKGNLKWVRERAKTEYDKNGNPLFTVGVVSDITENVKSRKEIIAQNSYIENLLESIPDLVFVVNIDGIYIGKNYNKTKKNLLLSDDYIGKSIREFMPENLCNHFFELFKNVKKTNQTARVTYDFPTKTGNKFFEATVKYLQNDEFIVVLRDISESYQYQQKIEIQNEYLKQLGEISLVGIWELDIVKQYVDWSEMVRKIHEVDENFDPNVEEAINFYLPQDRKIIEKSIDKLFKFGIPYDLTLKIKTASGKVKWVRTIGLPRFENDVLTKAYGTFQDISEIKERDLTIQKLSMAVEQSFASIVMTDLAGNIEYVNTKFTEVTGYTKEEVIGKNPRILRSDKSVTDYENMWETLVNGKTWSGEFLNRNKDGQFYWELGIIYPLFDELGNIINYIGVKEDITEKKQLQVNLIESELKLNNILESAKESILTVDENYSLLYFNHVFKEEFEERNQVRIEKGVNLLEILPEEKRLFWKEKIDQVFEKKSIQFEYQVTNNGEVVFHEVTANPIINQDKVIGVSIFGINITEKRKTEQIIKESESKYRIVAENNYNWEFWQGPDGNYIYNSPSCFKITGYTHEEFMKNPRLLYKILHPDDKERYINHHKNRISHDGLDTNTFRIIDKNGNVKVLEHICQTIYSDDGVYLGIRGTNVDITEKSKHIEAIKEQNKLLKEITWMQSHEFRAPLARMMSLIDFLNNKDFTVFDEQQLIIAIKQSADELDRMIRAISQKVYMTKSIKE